LTLVTLLTQVKKSKNSTKIDETTNVFVQLHNTLKPVYPLWLHARGDPTRSLPRDGGVEEFRGVPIVRPRPKVWTRDQTWTSSAMRQRGSDAGQSRRRRVVLPISRRLTMMVQSPPLYREMGRNGINSPKVQSNHQVVPPQSLVCSSSHWLWVALSLI